MPDADERSIALQMIATDLARLIRQADAHGLTLLAYLLEMAAAEAREELETKGAARPSIEGAPPKRDT